MPKKNSNNGDAKGGKGSRGSKNGTGANWESSSNIPSSFIGVSGPRHGGDITGNDMNGQGGPQHATGSGSATVVAGGSNLAQNQTSAYGAYSSHNQGSSSVGQSNNRQPSFGGPVFGPSHSSPPYLNSAFAGGNQDADRRYEDFYLHNENVLAGVGARSGYRGPFNGNGNWHNGTTSPAYLYPCEHGCAQRQFPHPACPHHSGGSVR